MEVVMWAYEVSSIIETERIVHFPEQYSSQISYPLNFFLLTNKESILNKFYSADFLP